LSQIRILSEHLANQIAAGEVIERPASVVKEFLENSIDAGAQRIAVQVGGDGTRLIRVIDDGCGMDSDDALLCLERHATSKLDSNDSNQLDGIRTLGFRGEAIPSIASVSQMTITTRPDSASLGTRIEIRYGRINKVHETGSSKGTVMEVRNLFGNQPARKKFLKTARTELSHIEDAVKNYALANPHISFSYSVNDTVLFEFDNSDPSPLKRFNSVYNRTSDQDVVVLGAPSASDSSEITIQGFLLPPDEVGVSARLRTFVNNRSVRDRLINHAVMEGLAGFMMKGRRPAGALFISIDPTAVDVNVHPAKQEIRFRKSQVIHQLVSLAARQAMQDFQDNLKSNLFGIPSGGPELKRPVMSDSEPADTPHQPEIHRTPLPFDMLPGTKTSFNRSTAEPPPAGMKKTPPPKPATETSIREPAPPLDISEHAVRQPRHEASTHPQRIRPLGQIADLYILCEADGRLLVIDQHAAHERLIFETLKNQFFSKKVTRQSLMFPQVLEIEPGRIQVLETHQETIRNLGIDIEDFGGGSWVIKAVPAILSKHEPLEILAGILEQLAGHNLPAIPSGRQAAVRIEDVLSSMACKAAVKSGRRMTMEEMESLLNEMINADVFSHCPHGRPVAKSFSVDEIKKWFHRT
jgi:DNA mismatch repair protein MutL